MSEIPDGYIIVPASAWQELVQHELKCQELAATVEVLKLPLKALLETSLGFGGSLQADGQFAYRVRESVFKKAEIALATTPQQHLLERDAQKGRAGFIACLKHFHRYDDKTGMMAIDDRNAANQYAEQIRQGEVK